MRNSGNAGQAPLRHSGTDINGRLSSNPIQRKKRIYPYKNHLFNQLKLACSELNESVVSRANLSVYETAPPRVEKGVRLCGVGVDIRRCLKTDSGQKFAALMK